MFPWASARIATLSLWRDDLADLVGRIDTYISDLRVVIDAADAEVARDPDPTTSFTRPALEQEGCQGFITFAELRAGRMEVPAQAGVYIVFRARGAVVEFLGASIGGRFKERDPSTDHFKLYEKWVTDAEVVYIGKGDNLRRRPKQYADFEAGRPVGHWGGRYIWQLTDSDRLLVAWMTCGPDEMAATTESRLLRRFKDEHGGRLPFANIADPSWVERPAPRRSRYV